MKNNFLIGISIFALTLGLSSCLFQDDIPGTELTKHSAEGETEVYHGKADSIDFKREITKEGFQNALNELQSKGILGGIKSAEFALRGGKQGAMPGPHAYQYQFSLETDNYAGYFTLPQNFGGRMVSTYYDSQDFNGGPWGSFMELKKSIVPLINHPLVDSIPEVKAIALTLYNYSAQEIADIYGAFPYVDYRSNKQEAPFKYNSGDEIYKTIVSNVNTVVECIDNFKNRPEWYQSGLRNALFLLDPISGYPDNDISNWKFFANSLKLRMAMHIVKIDPELAQQWAEEAVKSGVIETENQQFALRPDMIGGGHPLAEISGSWNDTRLNASFESMLRSLKHPMLDLLFMKNSEDIINKKDHNKFLAKDTKIVGLRSGIRMLEGQSYDVNFRNAYSRLEMRYAPQMPSYVMKLSEVLLLRAEGALRGWNMGGSAKDFYEKGIQYAFNGFPEIDGMYTKQLNEYTSLEKPVSYTYEDPFNERYNYPSTTKIGVKWNDGDDNEIKLEKIITQKYIANFPYSFEAWTDIRRTGYPKIFPVLYDDGDGSIPTGDVIRRIPFPEKNTPAGKADIDATGIKALGGADLQGTRVWWDATVGNF